MSRAYMLACMELAAERAHVKGNIEHRETELRKAERILAKRKKPNPYQKAAVNWTREHYNKAEGDHTDLVHARSIAAGGILFNPRHVAGSPGACPVARSRAATAAEIRGARPSAAFSFKPSVNVKDTKKLERAMRLLIQAEIFTCH